MANIVICADGTWNRPEEDIKKDFPTNVLKLSRAIKPSVNGVKQHVFYDWGLGSYHSRVSAGATGRGIHKNILDGYRYIVQNYAPNDKIYLFGFSRGSYTVRALSGLIYNCGILKRPDARLISGAWKIYKNPLAKNHPRGECRQAFSRQPLSLVEKGSFCWCLGHRWCLVEYLLALWGYSKNTMNFMILK